MCPNSICVGPKASVWDYFKAKVYTMWCLNPHLDPEEPTFLGLLIMIFLKETLKKGRSSGLQVALAIKANAPETHEVETTLNFTPSCDESFCFEVLGWVRVVCLRVWGAKGVYNGVFNMKLT